MLLFELLEKIGVEEKIIKKIKKSPIAFYEVTATSTDGEHNHENLSGAYTDPWNGKIRIFYVGYLDKDKETRELRMLHKLQKKYNLDNKNKI